MVTTQTSSSHHVLCVLVCVILLWRGEGERVVYDPLSLLLAACPGECPAVSPARGVCHSAQHELGRRGSSGGDQGGTEYGHPCPCSLPTAICQPWSELPSGGIACWPPWLRKNSPGQGNTHTHSHTHTSLTLFVCTMLTKKVVK